MNANPPVAAANDLTQIIRSEIAQSGGAISFSHFMSLALYHPVFGYYMRPHEKFGPRGDFITAPLLSPLFAQTLANSILDILREHPFILEWGAGNGQLAKDMLMYLRDQGLNPRYFIYDISPSCRAMQQEKLHALGDQVVWLEAPPESFEGAIIANEVLDALPVDLFHYRDGQLFERAVAWVDDHVEYVDRLPSWTEPLNIELAQQENYISEKHVYANDLVRQWIKLLKAGEIIIIDYGFLRDEYYHPDRSLGTLMCHYQHTAHDNPFVHIGEQDITAHVNFSDAIEIAQALGFDATLYTQAEYLIEHGILSLAEASFTENLAEQRIVSQALRKLLEPQEMGEFIKVLTLKSAFSTMERSKYG